MVVTKKLSNSNILVLFYTKKNRGRTKLFCVIAAKWFKSANDMPIIN